MNVVNIMDAVKVSDFATICFKKEHTKIITKLPNATSHSYR